ncbi:MAG: hypothetical protein RMK99_02275 [Anaerolineales bacterium]|nr:hypothetical protein [Anaerolineales bacterium]
MPRVKLKPGERVEMRCFHRRGNEIVQDWLPGVVVSADERMLAVRFETDVFSNNGWLVPDRTLWCTHGSPNLRRVTDERVS